MVPVVENWSTFQFLKIPLTTLVLGTIVRDFLTPIQQVGDPFSTQSMFNSESNPCSLC